MGKAIFRGAPEGRKGRFRRGSTAARPAVGGVKVPEEGKAGGGPVACASIKTKGCEGVVDLNGFREPAREILESVAGAVREGREGREGREEEAILLCRRALQEGIEAREAIREGLCRGMHQAGELFERHDYFLPELLLASEAVQAGLGAVIPALEPAGKEVEGRRWCWE